MAEKPTIERPEVEQSEKLKKRLHEMLSNIESGMAEDLIYPFTNYKDVFEIKKGFLIGLTKTFFDQLFNELRAKLEAIKKGAKLQEINWIVGHEVGHAARIYEMSKDQIPESEADLRQRGEAILKLYNVYRYFSFQVEEEMSPEEAEKIRIKQHVQKVMEETEKMVNFFNAPLLNEQEKKSALEQMKSAIQARIDELE